MIGKVINALNGWDSRRLALLQNVVENPDNYSTAAGQAKLEFEKDLISLAQGMLAGLESQYISDRKVAERQFQKINEVV